MARMHYGETKAQREAAWKAQFADLVVRFEPKHAGRIEWSSAQYFYNQGMDADEAAALYVNNRKEG